MTNHWNDIANSDCIMIIGSNAAENHPISFRHVMRARDKGAKLISVDPRFTRTSALADVYAPIRSGTDIAFIGGLYNYILSNNLYDKDYLLTCTNAPFLVSKKFKFNNKSGTFPGFDKVKKAYTDKSDWKFVTDTNGIPVRDYSLGKNTVFQHMKKHYKRYTPERVENATGMPKEKFLEIAKAYAETGKTGKAGTIMYAMGTTQHTYGSQNVRSYAVLQLLLGNVGVAGGGINALRGESNVQGSTDHCMLFHILPGYLKVPVDGDVNLDAYLKRATPKTNDPKSANWWQNYPKYIVSLLKAFYGDKAEKNNDFCFNYLPKTKAGVNYSHISLFKAMNEGVIKGFMVWGQNPMVGGPDTMETLEGLKKLDWMFVAELWPTETAEFWKAPGVNPKQVKTEVFLLPAAASVEKEGSISNSGRWMQWRYAGANPPGEAKSDLWMMTQIVEELKALYRKEGGKFPDPILDLSWNYGKGEPDPHTVAKEINGYEMASKKQVASFAKLADDGSTCSGNWLYCGSYTEAGNMTARRDPEDAVNKIGLYPKWSWCWPVNRRIIYNRASVNQKTGEPRDRQDWVIKWDAEAKKWIGDVPDGGWPIQDKLPFIMKPDGVASIFGPGLKDGPFPSHYEPYETPLSRNPITGGKLQNPAMCVYDRARKTHGTCKKFPVVATTFRVSEHWQAGAMTRNLPWLAELHPEMFVEVSPTLAKAKGIKSGDMIRLKTIRASIEAKAIVTERIKPFKLGKHMVEEVAIPWHWGYSGISSGATANMLTPFVGDANTMIPEFKAFLVDVEKV